MSSFTSLYTVRSGLDAARKALEVVGQNVANANTAGYTRQEVSFTAAQPTDVIRSAGRGISDVQVLRYRDEFLDRQYRSRSGMQSYYDTMHTQLSQVEQIMGDLSDTTGLRTALDQVFNSWDNLASHPADSAARSQVVTAAEDFINAARSSFNDLSAMRSNLDESIRDKVSQMNDAAKQLADLNGQIMSQEKGVQPANALKDRRDQLLDSLAKLGGTSSVMHDDGSVTVMVGTLPIVDKTYSYPINATVAIEADRDPDPTLVSAQQNLTTLDWNGSITPAPFQSGEVAALINMRDQSVPDYQKYLDNLVRTVANQVNTTYKTPDVNGNAPTMDIFTAADGTSPIGNTWMDIGINSAIAQDPSLITAAATLPVPPATAPAAGDGDRALSIARLRDQKLLTGKPVGTNTVTAGDYLRAVSSQLGLEVNQAQGQSDAADLAVQQVDKQRQSVSGVSLDDEMAKMIQFQQTYNAAARMMTTIDEMLDTVVNRIGTVGR